MSKNSPYSSLSPNFTYRDSSHSEFTTDSHGRVVTWSGDVGTAAGQRNLSAQRTLEGKNSEQSDAGHLLATNQGGSGEKYNMVPMNEKVNRRDYRAWERENEALVRAGYSVHVKGSLGQLWECTTNNPEAIMASREVSQDGQFLYTEHFSVTNYDLDDLEHEGESEAYELAQEYSNPMPYSYDEETDTVYTGASEPQSVLSGDVSDISADEESAEEDGLSL